MCIYNINIIITKICRYKLFLRYINTKICSIYDSSHRFFRMFSLQQSVNYTGTFKKITLLCQQTCIKILKRCV